MHDACIHALTKSTCWVYCRYVAPSCGGGYWLVLHVIQILSQLSNQLSHTQNTGGSLTWYPHRMIPCYREFSGLFVVAFYPGWGKGPGYEVTMETQCQCIHSSRPGNESSMFAGAGPCANLHRELQAHGMNLTCTEECREPNLRRIGIIPQQFFPHATVHCWTCALQGVE